MSTWTRNKIPFSKWGDVIAFGPGEIAVIAGKGAILASHDNGNSWKELYGGGASYRYTIDGGITYQASGERTATLPNTAGVNNLCSVESAVIAPSGRLYLKTVCEHTTQLWSASLNNEADVWHVVSFTYPENPSDGVYTPGHKFAVSGDRVLISGMLPTGSALLTTDDDGATWHPIWRGYPDSAGIVDIDFISDGQGWMLLGDGELLQTVDGGRTWQHKSTLSSESADGSFSLNFADAETGFIVGRDGLVLKTGDGGQTWQHQKNALPFSLYKVAAVGAKRAWAIGEKGAVAETLDGGISWRRVELGITKNLYFGLAIKGETAWIISDQYIYSSH
jgi:photosystem II stability/assembly factor-like uncharacterized protein